MSQALHGADVVIETRHDGFDIRGVLDTILGHWPAARFQNADEERVHTLADACSDPKAAVANEFFVYRSEASSESWRADGWTEEHGNDMLHVLVGSHPDRPKRLLLTVVLDSLTGDLLGLVDDIYEVVGQMASGRAHWRIDCVSELRAAGHSGDLEDFINTVSLAALSVLPVDVWGELAYHPREALKACEAVRHELGVPVSDRLVMWALLGLSKTCREAEAADRPRLSWVRG